MGNRGGYITGKCRFSCLKDKEIICVGDGRRLGFICDAEIDPVTGHICALLVPGPLKLSSLRLRPAFVIPWENIVRIGDDIILVNAVFPCKE